ncbi:hypothetical protein [Bradyrhizobium japonicum]|nr:hypothetical protein [Bradyrhizobium japonicum]MCD9819811.1 hypothetical protein [Bradyrhizobium japonicum]MEB2675144.1 hypothetical protein [Bradyrhizobium japonicum]WLB25017.1 hypothetical protein QIH85_24370 [Bradyrhizobium japonicum]WRI85521.1 hypothetical protein R3F75_26435 [Bradyrhizobium japonicum]
MSADRCKGCARVTGAIGALLISPIALVYVLWLAVYGVTDRRRRRRRGLP